MKATLKRFTGAKIREQQIDRPEEMLGADVSCVFVRDDGREVNCTARIKQTVGSDYRERIIEVGPVEGLEAGVEYVHHDFAEAARCYYTERIVKQGG